MRKNVYELLDACHSSEIDSKDNLLVSLKNQLSSSYVLDKNQKRMIRSVWKALTYSAWKCLDNIEFTESHILDFLSLSGAEFCFNSEVGATKEKFMDDIFIVSEGSSEGSGAQILYQGRNYGGNRRGFYVVVFTPFPHRIFRSDRFDVWESKNEATRMAQFLEEIPNGYVGVFAVADEASENMTTELEEALISFGFSKKTYDGWEQKIFGYSYAFAGVGVKGAEEGTALQNWARYEPGKKKIPVAIVGIMKGEVKND